MPPIESCRLPSRSSSSSGCPLTLKDLDASDLLPWLPGHCPGSTLLRSSPPLADALVLSALRFCRLRLFPYHRQPGSQVPYESPDQIHAPSAPDTAWLVGRSPAILLPGPRVNPGFDVVLVLFRCFTQRFACAHLSSPHMTRSSPRLLTLTFTTTVIEPKQLKAV